MKNLCHVLLGGAVFGALSLLSPAGESAEFHVSYSFCNPGKCTDGSDADGALIEVNGTLYGLTTEGGDYHAGTLYSFDRSTRAETLLHSFGQRTDAGYPDAGLIDVNGILYGTTFAGGSDTSCTFGCGAVFSFDPNSGVEKVLYSFCTDYPYCRDGEEPNGSLVAGNGTLYGTTLVGGGHGRGEVFSVDPNSGAETVVYSFCANLGDCADGMSPDSLIDVNGTLYGTTSEGGSGNCGGLGCGVVFSLDPGTGAETVLYTFTGRSDGSYPRALIYANGMLYGVAYAGGAGPCTNVLYGSGCGTIFSLDPATGNEKVLYSFCNQTNCTDGAYPLSLIEVHGRLYGTAGLGGTANDGVVFSFGLNTGKEKVLHSFCSLQGCGDGQWPDPGLLKWQDRLYGTTTYGGQGEEGVIFYIKRR